MSESVQNQERPVPGGENVLVEFEEGIAWVTLNRPHKRNAMSPALNDEMLEVLNALELDDRCGVLVLTGAGDSFTAGMDLKEFFKENDGKSYVEQMRIKRSFTEWTTRKLMHFAKPTIAMVNGWCFGGGFTPLISCDLRIAAEDAVFGLSEINWGIIPAGNVTRLVAEAIGQQDALYYIMTGETFTGRQAAEMRLVKEAVPREQLRERTKQLAQVLLSKNPTVMHAAKEAYKISFGLPLDVTEDYLNAKSAQATLFDPEKGRQQGLSQFVDEKSYKPGLQGYRR